MYATLYRAMPTVFERNLGIACRVLWKAAAAIDLDGEAEVRMVLEQSGLDLAGQ